MCCYHHCHQICDKTLKPLIWSWNNYVSFKLQRDNLDCLCPRFSHYTSTVSSFITSVTFMKECTDKKTDVNSMCSQT